MSVCGPLRSPIMSLYSTGYVFYASSSTFISCSNGPIFGSGADLYISSDCNTNQDSYSQLGRSYGDPSCLPHHLAGNYRPIGACLRCSFVAYIGEQYFIVEEYEVFGLAN